MSERPVGIFETVSGKLGQSVYENQAKGCEPELRFFVEIAFVPFEWDGEGHRPLLRIDNLLVPVESWQGLSEQVYDFPYAPKPGSLESAVLMFGEHNPADVTRIEFGAIENGKLNCAFETEVDFEIEADRDDLEQIEMSLNLLLDVEPLRVSTSLEKRCKGDAAQIAGAVKNVVDLSKYGSLEKLPGGFAYSITG